MLGYGTLGREINTVGFISHQKPQVRVWSVEAERCSITSGWYSVVEYNRSRASSVGGVKKSCAETREDGRDWMSSQERSEPLTTKSSIDRRETRAEKRLGWYWRGCSMSRKRDLRDVMKGRRPAKDRAKAEGMICMEM